MNAADDLEDASLLLLNCPHLQPLVHYVRIVLTRRRAAEVLPAFAQAMVLLTNAHTLEITYAHPEIATPIKVHFGGAVFASVRTAIMPAHAGNALRCCPNVTSVTACDTFKTSMIISAIGDACEHVTEVANFRFDKNTIRSGCSAFFDLQTDQ